MLTGHVLQGGIERVYERGNDFLFFKKEKVAFSVNEVSSVRGLQV